MDRKKERNESRFFAPIYDVRKKNYLFCNFKFEKKCINIKNNHEFVFTNRFRYKKAFYLDNFI